MSPPWVSETLEAMGRDGAGGLPAATVAKAYVHTLTAPESGATVDARRFG
ncbi:MAG TPA: hypothetical protein VHG91_11555 [Longimicrobium sp.]|nr:hypothetical protein [Longimicrobium sp.]